MSSFTSTSPWRSSANRRKLSVHAGGAGHGCGGGGGGSTGGGAITLNYLTGGNTVGLLGVHRHWHSSPIL